MLKEKKSYYIRVNLFIFRSITYNQTNELEWFETSASVSGVLQLL